MPPVDATVALLLERLNSAFPALGTEVTDAVEARRRFESVRRPQDDPTPVAGVVDELIDGPGGPLPLRVYHPVGVSSHPPLLLFLHGGGFVLGGLESHDEIVRSLVDAVGAVAVAVDYRLAPENPYPAALDDAWAALQWAARRAGELGADPHRIVVAGDSAGGNLAAAVAIRARDLGGPPLAAQLLLYPMLDRGCDTASYTENATGYYLGRSHLEWFWRQYLPGPADGTDPQACPARTADLTGLPPAIVVTAELDPLRDEGEAYAARLDAAGVAVWSRRYDGMFHGFLGFARTLAVALAAQREVTDRLRAVLANPAAEERR